MNVPRGGLLRQARVVTERRLGGNRRRSYATALGLTGPSSRTELLASVGERRRDAARLAEPDQQLPTAVVAECACPEFCERDHEQD